MRFKFQILVIYQFLLWPNPSAGAFNLELSKTNVSHLIEIFDTKGRLVHKETVSESGILSFNLSLNKGVYLVKVKKEISSHKPNNSSLDS